MNTLGGGALRQDFDCLRLQRTLEPEVGAGGGLRSEGHVDQVKNISLYAHNIYYVK